MGYNRPSPSSRGNHRGGGGGSFIVPSNPSGLKNEGSIKKTTKITSSGQNIRNNYSKSSAVGISSHLNGSSSTGHYRIGSNYGVRNGGNTNFTANPRIRKGAPSSTTAHNAMASFRSGPVKVVADNKKDASKRPSSASKVNKKSSKMVNKPSTRPGTASTRSSSNRPPSPGSRPLKSDSLFSSYNRHKNSKLNGATKKLGVSKQVSSTGKIKSTTNAVPKTKTKPQSPGRGMYSKQLGGPNTNTYTTYKSLKD